MKYLLSGMFVMFGLGFALGIFGLFLWAVGDEMTKTIFSGLGIVAVAIGVFAVGKSMGKEAGYDQGFKARSSSLSSDEQALLLQKYNNEVLALLQRHNEAFIVGLEIEDGYDEDAEVAE